MEEKEYIDIIDRKTGEKTGEKRSYFEVHEKGLVPHFKELNLLLKNLKN